MSIDSASIVSSVGIITLGVFSNGVYYAAVYVARRVSKLLLRAANRTWKKVRRILPLKIKIRIDIHVG